MPHSVAIALAVSMLSPDDSDDDDGSDNNVDCNDDDDDDHHHHHLVLIHYLPIYLTHSLTSHHANEYPRPLALSDGLFDIWSQRILSCHGLMDGRIDE
jgi:hypothetical protein